MLRAQLAQRFGRRLVAHDDERGIARHDAHEHEDERQHRQQRRQRVEQPGDEIADHRAAASFGIEDRSARAIEESLAPHAHHFIVVVSVITGPSCIVASNL